MSELSVPLESIRPCLQGVLPSWLVTCSAEGVPNATILSIVRYVDFERVALTRQFFNKTRANLDANPQAQVIVVDPGSGDQFALDLRYLHTESEGAIFDEVEANLAAVASQMGMSDVFRLRGVDIHRVLRCVPFGETAAPVQEPGAERDALPLLDEFMRRLALCVDFADAARVGLETLDDLFGFAYSILLTADERGDRLFAVSSNGYVPSGVGAEVPVGVGLVGVAAERRRVVCVPNLARSRAMNAAVQDSIRRSGAEPSAVEIELPGLERVQSAAAIPLLAHGELTGVLYLESERQGDFGPGKERLLRSPRRAARRRARGAGGGSGRERPGRARAGYGAAGRAARGRLLPGGRQRLRRRRLCGQGRTGPDPVEAPARARSGRAHLFHQPGAAARRAPRAAGGQRQPRGATARPA